MLDWAPAQRRPVQEQRRPDVTLTASSAPTRLTPPAGGAAPRGRRSRAVLLLPAAAVAVALVTGSPDPDPPAPAPSVDVELAVLPDAISVSTTGVLVVPVQLSNSGPAVHVERALAYASPVVHDAVVQVPEDVAAASRRRFVTLLAPDCRLLRPGSTVGFSASVLLRVEQGSTAEDVVLDLTTPAVRRVVQGLCGAD